MTKLKHKIRAMIDAFKFYMELKAHSKTSNHHRAELRSGMDKHYRLDTSYTQEPEIDGDRVTLQGQAENMARIEGITLNQAVSKIADKQSGMRNYDLAEDGLEEKIISLNRNKMQDFINQKKKRKPFYKADNKNDWE